MLLVSSAYTADKPTPEPDALKVAKTAILTAKAQTAKAKDAWDRSKLECTLWDQRFKREYQQWVKARGDARKAAQDRRFQAEADLKLSLEVRRLNWYQYELAARRERAAEEQLKTAEMENELARVEERVRALKTRPAPVPTPGTPGPDAKAP